MFNVTPETFWFKIVCKESSQSHPDDIIYLSWRNMTFEHRMRWDWYFLYRAALMQVQHPRWTVNVFWGSEIISTADDLLKWKKNKITAKKRKITELNNIISQAKNEWCKLFPIEDDHNYKFACDKLLRLQNELIEFENDRFGITP